MEAGKQRITAAEVESARRARLQNPLLGRVELSRVLRVSPDRARRILDRLAAPAADNPASVPPEAAQGSPDETHDLHGDHWEISIPRTRICTLEQLMEHCQVDTSLWEVERWVCNKWEVGAKDANDEIKVEPLFQVKAWLRRRRVVAAAKLEVAELFRAAEKYAPRYPKLPQMGKPSGNLLELSPADHHFGKLAWGKETGGADYDTSIAMRHWRECISGLIDRTSHYQYERVALVLGHDLQNADNRNDTTTGGNPQDCDSRHQKVFSAIFDAAVWAIEVIVGNVAPVDVYMIPGNHDAESNFFLGFALKAWFKNAKHVNIDNSETSRKCLEFGRVGLMFDHGNEIKLDEYPLMLAREQREMWGRTFYNEIHTGDKHQRKTKRTPQDEVIEKRGIVVRILPSLCPADAWHASKGYTGNLRASEAFMWNKEAGLLGTAIYSVGSDK